MGGSNPYVDEADVALPTKRYTITFLPMDEKVEVDPEALPYGRDGKPCRTCGRPIVRIVVGQRGTHLCRRCQPAPRGR